MSGAKNCPETPRQRMIGMMYLVLTAMLALNVSSEILNGFKLVDDSLHTTISSSEMRNKGVFEDFISLYNKNPEKVREWLEQAKKVKTQSDELYNYIQDFKYQILKISDGKKADKNGINIINKENIDAAGEYALTKGNGKKLKAKIENYRQLLINITPDSIKKKMYGDMFKTGMTWEAKIFESMPVSAAITILTKYQSDVRTAEAETIQYLKTQTNASNFRVNQVRAFVIPNSRYVIQGGKYSADIVLSATDSTGKYEYYVNGSRVANGKYEFIASKTGIFKYSGQIKTVGNDGNWYTYKFPEESFVVGKPAVTISNEDLNVVYKGIDHRFSVSVPGIPAENVHVTVEGGTATRAADGNYMVRATRDDEIKINVTASVEGREQAMGSGVFRVKYLPDPLVYLQYTDAGGIPRLIKEGRVTRKQLQGCKLIASYGEDALIKANFQVTSFIMYCPQTGSASAGNGSQLNGRQLGDIDSMEGGDEIYFKNIKAVGPDGKQRNLNVLRVEL